MPPSPPAHTPPTAEAASDFDHRRRPLILVSSTRSGSTLLQRMLNTHPQFTMWGEHVGILKSVREIRDAMVEFQRIIDRGFEQRGHLIGPLHDADNLSEHINPFSSATIETRLADLTVELFASTLPPEVRWGFKEVRYDGADLAFFHAMFPQAHFVILARDPSDQISSFVRAPWRPKPDLDAEAGRERLQTAVSRVAGNWTRQYASLREFAESNPDNTTTVRYDEITAGSVDLERLFERLDLGAPDPDRVRAVLAKKSGSSDRTSAWTTSDRAFLDRVISELVFDEAHRSTRTFFLGEPPARAEERR